MPTPMVRSVRPCGKPYPRSTPSGAHAPWTSPTQTAWAIIPPVGSSRAGSNLMLFVPAAQQAITPRLIMPEFGADTSREICSPGSVSLADIPARIRDLDRMGFDSQVLFPSTLYAHMTADPGFEAALYRSYNRYVGG